jgi:hypothetical protein
VVVAALVGESSGVWWGALVAPNVAETGKKSRGSAVVNWFILGLLVFSNYLRFCFFTFNSSF